MKVWESLEDVFKELNKKNINYVVLRNYEMLNKGKLLKYHEDIDFLCNNPKILINTLGAMPRATINYYIKVKEKNIPIDIRWIGDGYYDKIWQIHMLKNRKLYKNMVYVMNNNDYFYSLLYHALIQKRKIPIDYNKRLINMGKHLNIEFNDIEDYRKSLNLFMKERNYYYTNTKDSRVYLNFDKVPKSMIKINILWFIKKQIINLWDNIRELLK